MQCEAFAFALLQNSCGNVSMAERKERAEQKEGFFESIPGAREETS
jgi:hypothetical protein